MRFHSALEYTLPRRTVTSGWRDRSKAKSADGVAVIAAGATFARVARQTQLLGGEVNAGRAGITEKHPGARCWLGTPGAPLDDAARGAAGTRGFFPHPRTHAPSEALWIRIRIIIP